MRLQNRPHSRAHRESATSGTHHPWCRWSGRSTSRCPRHHGAPINQTTDYRCKWRLRPARRCARAVTRIRTRSTGSGASPYPGYHNGQLAAATILPPRLPVEPRPRDSAQLTAVDASAQPVRLDSAVRVRCRLQPRHCGARRTHTRHLESGPPFPLHRRGHYHRLPRTAHSEYMASTSLRFFLFLLSYAACRHLVHDRPFHRRCWQAVILQQRILYKL